MLHIKATICKCRGEIFLYNADTLYLHHQPFPGDCVNDPGGYRISDGFYRQNPNQLLYPFNEVAAILFVSQYHRHSFRSLFPANVSTAAMYGDGQYIMPLFSFTVNANDRYFNGIEKNALPKNDN